MTFHWPQIACLIVIGIASMLLRSRVERAGVNAMSRGGLAFLGCGLLMTIAGIVLGGLHG